MERTDLKYQGTNFKKGDIIVFNEEIIGNVLSFHFAEDMQSWAVKMDESANSCYMGYVRFASEKEKKTFLAFTKPESEGFKAVSVRYTAFF